MKTLRNLALGAAAAAVLGIGTAAAQDPAKPQVQERQHDKHHCRHGGAGGEHRHGHGKHQKDEKHEHPAR